MSGFKNSRKTSFLGAIPKSSIDNKTDDLASRCKFNFSYFTKDPKAGQDFSGWSHRKLILLLNKLKDFSRSPLKKWENESIGSGKKKYNVLQYYDKGFPTKKSVFNQPKHIPHQARWARFRFDSSTRLIGFVIPDKYNHVEQNNSGYNFCCNTFYVVFLDENHEFYVTKK